MNLTLELSGLNLERLLRTAGENGVRLQNVRRADERTMRVTVSAAQKRKAGRALRAVWLADDGGSRGLAASAHPNDEKTMDARRGDAAQRSFGSLSLPK